jgi:hypothetical protein
MSPELEKLLQALYEKRTCPPEEKPQRDATFERLLQDAIACRLRMRDQTPEPRGAKAGGRGRCASQLSLPGPSKLINSNLLGNTIGRTAPVRVGSRSEYYTSRSQTVRL